MYNFFPAVLLSILTKCDKTKIKVVYFYFFTILSAKCSLPEEKVVVFFTYFSVTFSPAVLLLFPLTNITNTVECIYVRNTVECIYVRNTVESRLVGPSRG